MKSPPVPERPTTADPLSPEALGAMLDTARTLQRAAEAGATLPLLKGRIFAVLCTADDDGADEVALIDRAATELGARVAHIRPHLTERSDPHTVELTGQMLGRLYSAVVCQGVAPALRQRLGAVAGIPIHGSLDAPGHAVSRVAGLLGGGADDRKLALQALLLRSVG